MCPLLLVLIIELQPVNFFNRLYRSLIIIDPSLIINLLNAYNVRFCFDSIGTPSVKTMSVNVDSMAEQPTKEINVQVDDCSTDTRILSVVLRKIQGDTGCDKVGPLRYTFISFLPVE